jgi:hypothetical protein
MESKREPFALMVLPLDITSEKAMAGGIITG